MAYSPSLEQLEADMQLQNKTSKKKVMTAECTPLQVMQLKISCN